MIGEAEALSNIKRGLRHSVLYNDPELSIKQAGWFVSAKNVDKIKITAKFGNDAKRTTSIPKIKGESKTDFKTRATKEARRSELGAIDRATRKQSVSRANAMNKSFKARGRDAMLEIYVNGLLSSAKTFEVNLLGNSTAIITSVIDRAYAGFIKKGGVPEGVKKFKSKVSKDTSYTFKVPGIYAYQCTPHKNMGMIGFVIVGNNLDNLEDIQKIKFRGKSKKVASILIEQLK
jgi:pseudoazurin